MKRILLLAVLLVSSLFTMAPKMAVAKEKVLSVTATAYTLRESETKRGNIGLAAWGDILKPGMKAIAVSRDLINQGLTHGTRVRIDGLDGEYVVRDKMHNRWRNKIDIFMGHDLQRALNWGKRGVTIRWNTNQ